MSDPHEDARAALVIVRKAMRAMPIERGTLEDRYRDQLMDMLTAVTQHQALTERESATSGT